MGYKSAIYKGKQAITVGNKTSQNERMRCVDRYANISLCFIRNIASSILKKMAIIEYTTEVHFNNMCNYNKT